MSLLITLNDDCQVELETGKPIWDIVPHIGVRKVVKLMADELELKKIRERFSNIPDNPKRSCITWVGDLAEFIYLNYELS